VTRLESIFQWRDQVNRHLPFLSQPQAFELALWSVGMVLCRTASLSAVSLQLGIWLEQATNTLRQRLRDWYLPAGVKSGVQRTDWKPSNGFADLLTWVVSLLPDRPDYRVFLALDACNLKDRVTILCISVLVGGSAIPVAWRCTVANEPASWKPLWLALLQTIEAALPALPQNDKNREVIVLADRGLWAQWLYLAIESRGWHPLLRVNGGQTGPHFRRLSQPTQQRQPSWHTLSSFLPKQGQEKGQEIRIPGQASGEHVLPCTLVVFWGESAKEPWYLLTDSMDSVLVEGALYGRRFWIEHQFKSAKSEGWHWEKSRMSDPERVDRMWFAYAVGMLWALSNGSQTEAKTATEAKAQAVGQASRSRVSDHRPLTRPLPNSPALHRFSWFSQGVATLLSYLSRGVRLTCPTFNESAFRLAYLGDNTA